MAGIDVRPYPPPGGKELRERFVSLVPKNVKRTLIIILKIFILVQGFCPLKTELLDILSDFILIVLTDIREMNETL